MLDFCTAGAYKWLGQLRSTELPPRWGFPSDTSSRPRDRQ